jgi:hypothetical protein
LVASPARPCTRQERLAGDAPDMTTPSVTEIPSRLEPVTSDPFITGLGAAAASTGSSMPDHHSPPRIDGDGELAMVRSAAIPGAKK